MSERTIVRCNPAVSAERWQPTTLDQLGKDEKFFENVLAETPALLGLESRRTGIHGPYRLFQQVAMETPSGRSILPDIVILAASGHVIVVEVKRYVNPELRDRAVIAQIIDYASSFAAMSDQQCVRLFAADNGITWADAIAAMFPDDTSPNELADVLVERMQKGEVNLVIACDKIPSGLPDVVSGIASQSTLGFDLDLVEVVPFVREVSESAEILFVPSTRMRTEIVSRTAVTVTYREGDFKPSTSVQTTSLEDIEENIKVAGRSINPDARVWTPEEVDGEVQKAGKPGLGEMLQFAKEHSADGQYLAPGKKVRAAFGLYVKGRLNSSEEPARRMLVMCNVGWDGPTIYLYFAKDILPEDAYDQLIRRLNEIFGSEINTELKEAGTSYGVLAEHIKEFKELMLWVKEQAESRL